MESFWTWWQHLPGNIDPVIFQFGGFKLKYYGVMYLVGFAITYFVALYRINTEARWKNVTKEDVQGLIVTMIVGLMIGSRLGYVFFYKPGYYLAHPLEIVLPFSFENGFHFTGLAGMSYHGGVICAFIAMCYYGRKSKMGIRNAGDLVPIGGTLGYTFGRLGNFLNGELFGRVTEASIGMYFPRGGTALRHPSQLYEAFGEGIVLFLFLWFTRKKIKTPGTTFALYISGYAFIRFFIEFFREPDKHLGFVFFSFSMGQVLCGIYFALGIGFYLLSRWARTREQAA